MGDNIDTMTAEYTPEFDFDASRNRLLRIADHNVEITPQSLYEGIVDVLASRGGQRWEQLDEIGLSTKSGIHVYVGYDEALAELGIQQVAWINTRETDNPSKNYEVRRWVKDGVLLHELYEVVDLDTGEANAVSNFGNLAPARLYGLLTDAHLCTAQEELTDDAFSPES